MGVPNSSQVKCDTAAGGGVPPISGWKTPQEGGKLRGPPSVGQRPGRRIAGSTGGTHLRRPNTIQATPTIPAIIVSEGSGRGPTIYTFTGITGNGSYTTGGMKVCGIVTGRQTRVGPTGSATAVKTLVGSMARRFVVGVEVLERNFDHSGGRGRGGHFKAIDQRRLEWTVANWGRSPITVQRRGATMDTIPEVGNAID